MQAKTFGEFCILLLLMIVMIISAPFVYGYYFIKKIFRR